ncbi:MAG TPA: rod shape-determining protein MreC [Clostridia bacterium]|nr:rod shape-determining protein MreC [Clostridia bacterium]
MPRKYSIKWIVSLILLVVLALFAMRITSLDRPHLTKMEAGLKDVIMPAQLKIANFGRQIYRPVSMIFSIGKLADENEDLRKRVSSLEAEVMRLNEYKSESERLQSLLEFKTLMSDQYNLITATVAGRDPGNWFGTITINKGANDGIEKNMPVLSEAGLVGKIVTASGDSSVVLLLTDPLSGVGGLIQESRTPGVVEGVASGYGLARLIHIREDAEVEVGQTVITSGLGGGFPRGIPLGKVTNIRMDSSGLLKTALIQPFVDFNRLEEVFVLSGLLN